MEATTNEINALALELCEAEREVQGPCSGHIGWALSGASRRDAFRATAKALLRTHRLIPVTEHAALVRQAALVEAKDREIAALVAQVKEKDALLLASQQVWHENQAEIRRLNRWGNTMARASDIWAKQCEKLVIGAEIGSVTWTDSTCESCGPTRIWGNVEIHGPHCAMCRQEAATAPTGEKN